MCPCVCNVFLCTPYGLCVCEIFTELPTEMATNAIEGDDVKRSSENIEENKVFKKKQQEGDTKSEGGQMANKNSQSN